MTKQFEKVKYKDKQYIFQLPSKKLVDAYDKKRELITKELEEQNHLNQEGE